MSKKKIVSLRQYKQAKKEKDKTVGERMYEVARNLDKCGSTTIWKVAMKSYRKRLSEGKDVKKPKVEDAIEWRGDSSAEGKLALVGLARCCRMQCPLCSYLQSLVRREKALEWARQKDWTGYYGVSLTFTVPHKLSDSESVESFGKILANLEKSYKRFSLFFKDYSHARSAHRSMALESLGYLSSLEFTFGKNGLHPHFHTLFLTKNEKDVESLRKFFRKDRVRVWKESGGSLLRMPEENEDKSFSIIFSPAEEGASPEKIVNYITKGLYETLSSFTKDEQKQASSMGIFELASEDLRYFSTFYDSTKGKRFYRAGGICKQISKIKDHIENEEIDSSIRSNFDSIIRISAKDHSLPEGMVTQFFELNRNDFFSLFPSLSAEEIKVEMLTRWNSFLMHSLASRQRQRRRSKEQDQSVSIS